MAGGFGVEGHLAYFSEIFCDVVCTSHFCTTDDKSAGNQSQACINLYAFWYIMHFYGHTLCAVSCLNITVHLSALHAVLYIQQVCRRSKEFSESMVTWDMGSPFYSKWTVMQWTHPSSLRTTKCKVCQYAGRLWHLYCVLQESSELYSYFEIQKWTYAVTCRADCFRLLAGRCMNVCHEVWSLSTVIRIQYTTNTRSFCSLENPTYGADIAQRTITFGPGTQHFQGHQFYSKNNSGA